MGKDLGCGAYLKILRRVACDHLTIAQSIRVDELEKRCSTGAVPLVPLHSALTHLRAFSWQSPLLSRLRLGQQEVLAQIGTRQNGEGYVAILDSRGELAALIKWVEDVGPGRWRLFRIFRA